MASFVAPPRPIDIESDFDSNSDIDCDLLEAIRWSKVEYFSGGAGPSLDPKPKDRSASTLGVEVAAFLVFTRLTKKPKILNDRNFLEDSPDSVLTKADLIRIRSQYGIPPEVAICLPFDDELADTVTKGWIYMYEIYF